MSLNPNLKSVESTVSASNLSTATQPAPAVADVSDTELRETPKTTAKLKELAAFITEHAWRGYDYSWAFRQMAEFAGGLETALSAQRTGGPGK